MEWNKDSEGEDWTKNSGNDIPNEHQDLKGGQNEHDYITSILIHNLRYPIIIP